MDRCQRKLGCENLADRDGCEETGGERKARGREPHARWGEKLPSGQETGRRRGLGCMQHVQGKGGEPDCFCDWGLRGHGPLGGLKGEMHPL